METIYLLSPLFLILGLVLYVVYHFLIKIYFLSSKFQKMDPNLKVFIAPFFGLVGIQKQNIEKYGDSHRFVKDMIKENPDQLAYLTNVGHKAFLILCDPKLIKEVSLSPKRFRKFNLFKHSNMAYSRGIFFAEGQEWTKQRAIIRHSFNHDQLKKMIPKMNKSIDTFAVNLQKKIEQADSKKVVFNVLMDTQILIGEILVRIFFSQQAIKKKVGDMPLSIALADFTTTMFNRSRSGENILLQLFFGEKVSKMSFSKLDKDLKDKIEKIRTILGEILDDRLALKEDNQNDFIAHYISEMRRVDLQIAEAQKKNEQHQLIRITKQEIMHQLISFYFAGIDTTGHMMAFGLYSLAEYPQCRKKVVEEIKSVIKSPEDITYENLQKLKYTGFFLDECLRMWTPAVGILTRVAKEDVTIGPYNIPAGTLVGTNIIGLMNNQKYYEEPQTFKPERWATPGAHSSEPYSFIPFSAGTRSCIGKYLALMEAKLIMVKFLNEFDFERTDVPLRLHAKFLYEPIEEDLISLKKGGSHFY